MARSKVVRGCTYHIETTGFGCGAKMVRSSGSAETMLGARWRLVLILSVELMQVLLTVRVAVAHAVVRMVDAWRAHF